MRNVIHSIQWRLAWYQRRIHLKHPPEYVNVEPTNACNLQCTVCSLDRTRPSGLMSLDLAKAILDDAAATGVREVRFFLAGEPMLHPQLPEMVKHASRVGLKTVIHTNATRLTTKLSRNLIQAGLHELSVSFDGQDAREYEAVHIGATYEGTLENVIGFLKEKQSLQSQTPRTVLQIIQLSPDDSNKLRPDFQSHFDGLPLDQIKILPPFTWPEQEAKGFVARRGSRYFPCQALWQSVSIGWDGSFLGCCGDLNHLWQIGKFPEQKIWDVWNGPAMTGARKRLKAKDLDGMPLCYDCSAVWRNHHPIWSDLRDGVSWIRHRLGGRR